MKVLLISEHYYPRLGGVTTFVDRIASELHAIGNKITLVVPGEGKGIMMQSRGFGELLLIGLNCQLTGRISSKRRRQFVYDLQSWIRHSNGKEKWDIIHVLFGMYAIAHLNLTQIGAKIVKTCTIHNIPPQECASSWLGDMPFYYWKDKLRLNVVRWINEKRILRNRWQHFFVPSEYVARALSKIVDKTLINTIGHGLDRPCKIFSGLINPNELNLLTISGITPHKRLHIIPEIALGLINRGITFKWVIVGSPKNKRYVRFLESRIKEQGLVNYITVEYSVLDERLDELLKKSDVYVHTSHEEGFCLAFLEALSYGNFAIGCSTGAIPELIQDFWGTLTDGSVSGYVDAIDDFQQNKINELSSLSSDELERKYSWQNAAKMYHESWVKLKNHVVST